MDTLRKMKFHCNKLSASSYRKKSSNYYLIQLYGVSVYHVYGPFGLFLGLLAAGTIDLLPEGEHDDQSSVGLARPTIQLTPLIRSTLRVPAGRAAINHSPISHLLRAAAPLDQAITTSSTALLESTVCTSNSVSPGVLSELLCFLRGRLKV